MNKYVLVALSVTGGILSALAWMDWCSGLILLIGFVPFFLIENHLFENRTRYSPNALFIFLLPGFVLFCILTFNWISVVSIVAAIFVVAALSFLMAFTFWLSHYIRLKAGSLTGYVSLITFWLTFEFLCLNHRLFSPWINLGNGLSKDILFIQWYEVTGTAGGTLWILASNLFFSLFLIKAIKEKRRSRLFLAIWFTVLIIPSAISLVRFVTIKPSEGIESEVVIIQPNIDPYNEKFVIPFEKQLENVLEMAKSAVTGETDWILTPETTVDDPVNEDELADNKYVKMIKGAIIQYPGASVVAGMVSYKIYPPTDIAPSQTARKINSSGLYYDHFNSAFKIDTGKTIEIYHKSKLVPGVEMQRSSLLGKLLSKILPNLGGTKWGYGVQNARTCFEHSSINLRIAPVICFESVFGKYVTDYVKKGAEAIFIITNDGWWKNSNGYKHHLSYASLRAIETRRPVARAANTGISCLIDIRGRIIQRTTWWTRATLKGSFIPESRITPYVKYGDYLMVISSFLSSIVLIFVFLVKPVLKK